jgi:DNA modification methylase
VETQPKGKTLEALAASRVNHELLLSKFGTLPQSIMVHDKADKAVDLLASDRSYTSTLNENEQSNDYRRKFRVSGSGVGAGSLSRFPQNVGRSLLLLYTKEGDTVIDPFAGHNSRMELCWRNNRNYIGQDLSHTFMEANRILAARFAEEATQDMYGKEHFKAWIKLFEGDSRTMKAETESGDFTITSPPYWDIEFYGEEPEQLGTGRSYEDFLAGLYRVMVENFRCLKPGAFCVWCINDFRKDGKFYSYHEHTAEGLRQAGFIQHDIAITDLGSSMRACFPNQVIEQKILPKRHEYCLIFRKPQANEKPDKVVKPVKTAKQEQSQPPTVEPVKKDEPKGEIDDKWKGNWWE